MMTRRRNRQESASHLALLSVPCCLPPEEDGQRRSLGSLGDVDDLLQSRHTERHVLGGHAGVVERVECHLSGRLTQRLRG